MATESTAVAAAKKPTELEQAFSEYAPEIAMALPEHVSVEKFQRVVLTSINQNTDLAKADRRSLFTSCVACAQDGLFPDGKEAALVIFKTKIKEGGKDKWISKVQYMPMVAGIRKKMRNSGEVKSAVARVVYDGDEFDYVYGDEEYITHRPALDGNRGNIKFAYAIIKLENGEVIREVMDKAEIDQVRKVSKAATNGPWVGWYGEMARKTVLRRAAKSAPTSADLDTVFKRDNEILGDDPLAVSTMQHATPPRPVLADYSLAEAGHADPDKEFQRVAGDVVTEDGEVIEQQKAEIATAATELPSLPPRPNKAQWTAWCKAATAILNAATKDDAGAFEKDNREIISGLNADQPDMAIDLVNLMNERMTQPDDEPQG